MWTHTSNGATRGRGDVILNGVGGDGDGEEGASLGEHNGLEGEYHRDESANVLDSHGLIL
jgi:hypothetical protein